MNKQNTELIKDFNITSTILSYLYIKRKNKNFMNFKDCEYLIKKELSIENIIIKLHEVEKLLLNKHQGDKDNILIAKKSNKRINNAIPSNKNKYLRTSKSSVSGISLINVANEQS